MSEICKKLESNYDGSLLDNVSRGIKETFKGIVTESKDSGNGNVPLINIIYNYFHGVLPSTRYISGPMSLSYHTSDKYDMKIYIFGELHGNEGQCSQLSLKKSSYLNISEYLHKVFLNSDKFIDFYLEDYLFNSMEFDRNKNFLNMLSYDFRKCLNPNTRSECIYKTVRTHFVDTRREQKGLSLVGTNPFENFTKYLEDFLLKKKIDNKEELSEFKEFGKKLLNCKNHTDIIILLIDIAKEIPIIKKALKRCNFEKEYIFFIFSNILTKIYSDVDGYFYIDIHKLHFTIKKFIKNKFLDDDIEDLIQILISIGSPIVDIYTICRMFKTFKNKDNLPTKPRNIIYYAGYAHSEIIRSFLDFLDFERSVNTSYADENGIRCLDINGIKLDFKKPINKPIC
jgi:hypothetical protein